MRALVGYTGFVGGNLAAAGTFDGLYNSKNIEEAFGTKPDILYYAAVPAEKFTANRFPPTSPHRSLLCSPRWNRMRSWRAWPRRSRWRSGPTPSAAG